MGVLRVCMYVSSKVFFSLSIMLLANRADGGQVAASSGLCLMLLQARHFLAPSQKITELLGVMGTTPPVGEK